MRSYPSCWNKTLAKLGFRRKLQKRRRACNWGRIARIESLESRQMLTGNTYVVTTLDDVAVEGTANDSLWSLREALAHAAADGQNDKDFIDFAASLAGEKLDLSLGELVIDSDVEILGPGQDKVEINAEGASRVFRIEPGVEATIKGLTITGGGNVTEGGGVFNEGNLRLEEVAVVGNQTLFTGAASGGGILSRSASGQPVSSLHLINSTVDGNRSKYGGGLKVDVATGGVLEISGSTFSHNTALNDQNSGLGGGMWAWIEDGANASIVNSTFSANSSFGGGGLTIYGDGDLLIVNDTITDNHADVTGGFAGGLLNIADTIITMHNTILAKNTDASTWVPDVWGSVGGTTADPSSHNILGVQHSGLATSAVEHSDLADGANGNQVGNENNPLDPLLGPLADYGGPTRTHALLEGSVATDTGSNAAANSAGLAHDQRGHDRIVSRVNTSTATADIGAFERGLVVSTLTDEVDTNYADGHLSLREALILAGTQPGRNQIAFDSSLSGGVLNLSLGELNVNSDVEIDGLGQDRLEINAMRQSRIFRIEPGVEATIKGLTITGGGNVTEGGGVFNEGNLRLEEVAVVGNQTLFTGAASGGGILSRSASGQPVSSLHLINSTVDGNRSRYGGGLKIDVADGGVLEISGSTFSHNIAMNDQDSGLGGGMWAWITDGAEASIVNSTFSANSSLGGGGLTIYGDGDLLLVNDTITDNHADVAGGFAGGVLNIAATTVTMHNTILAKNTDASSWVPDVWGSVGGTIADPSSYNILGVQHSGLAANAVEHSDLVGGINGNQVGDESDPLDPRLAPLADNNGPTNTHAPLVDSPTIDLGSNTRAINVGLTHDQRGHRRPMDLPGVGNDVVDYTDIGAFEAGNPTTLTVKRIEDTYDATHVGDHPELTLREALTYALTTGAIEDIKFSQDIYNSRQPIQLDPQLGELFITSGINILAAGAELLTVNANGMTHAFNLDYSPLSENLKLQGLRITGASSYAISPPSLEEFNRTVNVTIDRVEIVGNGGGIYILGGLSPGRTLFISNSLIANNAGEGLVVAYASAQIQNSTFSNNRGGLSVHDGEVTLRNVTVAYNTAAAVNPYDAGGSPYGGVYAGLNGQLYLANSIVAENVTEGGEPSDVSRRSAGANSGVIAAQSSLIGYAESNALSDLGGSIISDDPNAPIDAQLTPLGYYGGSTRGHALRETSPAVDSGTDALAVDLEGMPLPNDQRGFARRYNLVDIGAYELERNLNVPGDFNGDGRDDEAFYDARTGNINILTHLGGNQIELNSWGSLPVGGSLFGPPQTWQTFSTGDFNGDGRDDLFARSTEGFGYFLLSESTQFIGYWAKVETAPAALQLLWSEQLIGDFDGDGADELIGRASSTANWQLLDFDEQRGILLRSSVGNPINTSVTAYYVGDANRDNKDDLIARYTPIGSSTHTWYVGLSQINDDGTGAFLSAPTTPTTNLWAAWFNGYVKPDGTVHDSYLKPDGSLDADGPYRRLVEAFAKIYNNVELDLYYGIKKGPAATIDTGSANPWDQALAFMDEIKSGPYGPSLVTGSVTVPFETARDWLGVRPNANDYNDTISTVRNLLDPLSQSLVTYSADNSTMTFDHAWSSVIVPTAGGLDRLNLDPSWKFKDRQDGVRLFSSTDLNGTDSFQQRLFDEFKYLNKTVVGNEGGKATILPDTPLEFFEGELQQWLIEAHPGKSLADVPYDGPLKNRVVDTLPTAPWIAGTDLGTLDEILVDPSKRKDFMHRFRISLVAYFSNLRIVAMTIGDSPLAEDQSHPSMESVDGSLTFAKDGLRTFRIHTSPGVFTGQTIYQVYADHELLTAEPSEYSSTTWDLNVHVRVFAPGESVPGGTNPQWGDVNSQDDHVAPIGKDSIAVIRLDGDQVSSSLFEARNSSALADGTSNVYELADLGAEKFILDSNQSTKRIESLLGVDVEQQPGFVTLYSSHNKIDVDYAPYGIVPNLYNIGEVIRPVITRSISTTDLPTEVNQLTLWQAISHRHQLIEELLSSEGGSAIRVLQRLYGGETISTAPYIGYVGYFATELVPQGDGELRYPAVYWHHEIAPDFVDFTGTTRIKREAASKHLVWTSTVPIKSSATPSEIADAENEINVGYTAIANFMNSKGYMTNTQVSTKTAIELTGLRVTSSGIFYNPASALVGPSGTLEIGGVATSAIVTDSLRTHFGALDNSSRAAFRGDQVPSIFRAIESMLRPVSTGLGYLPVAPASVSSGNVFPSATDIAFPNAGVSLAFKRQYNSRLTRDIGLGVGWSHSFSDRILIAQANGADPPDVIWITSEGFEHRFDFQQGTYVVPPELLGEFSISGNQYLFKDRDGNVITFEKVANSSNTDRSPHARLLSKSDLNGNGIEVLYATGTADEISQVREIAHVTNPPSQAGRRLAFEYSTPTGTSTRHIQRIDKVATTSQGDWTLEYAAINGAAYLTKVISPVVTNPTTPATIHEYRYFGQATEPAAPEAFIGLMKKEIKPNLDTQSFEYYPNRRVYRVTDGDGFKQTFSYDLVNGRTTVRDARGNEEIYSFDSNGLITRQIHADRTRVETQWGVSAATQSNPHAVVPGTEFLQSRTRDEVGATERFTYYALEDGFMERELKQTISKQFLTSNDEPVDGEQEGIVTDFYYSNPSGTPIVNLSQTVINPKLTTNDPMKENLKTEFTYDSIGRLTSSSDALGNATDFSYYTSLNTTNAHEVGLLRSTILPKGHFHETNLGNEAVAWRPLNSSLLSITGSQLTIVLESLFHSVNETDNVVADAIRLDRIDDDGAVVTVMLDDGDIGFSTTGTTTAVTGNHRKYHGDAVIVTKTNTATWSFTGLQPGKYRVSATWTSAPTNNSEAEYRIYNGAGTLLHTQQIDQTWTPDEPGKTYFNSFETIYTYDAAGNVISTTHEGLPTTTSSYHHTGALASFKDSSNVETAYTVDVLGRTTEVKQTGNGITSPVLLSLMTYDEAGHLKTTTDALGQTTVFDYDHRGHVISQTNADGSKSEFKYDAVGNLAEATDELGRTTQFVYDGRNRLIQRIHPDAAIDEIRYDGIGRVAATIDGNGHETTFSYDAAGRVMTTVNADPNPAKNTASNRYDELGRLDHAVDFSGVTTKYLYDALGRVTQTRTLNKQTPTGPPITLTTVDYDAHGNIQETVVYDVPGLVQANIEIPPDPRSLIAAEVLTGRVQEVRYSYDSRDRLVASAAIAAKADGFNGDVVTRIEYDGAGRIRFQTDELSQRTEFIYDAYGRLVQTKLPDPDGPAEQYTHPITAQSYDAAGNVVAVTDANEHTSTYVYDKRNRVVAMIDAKGNVSRSVFDAAGQLVAEIDALGRASYSSYNARGQVKLVRMVDPDGSGSLTAPVTQYEYDEAGNVDVVIAANGHRTEYKYDELNRVDREISRDIQIADGVDFTVVTGGSPVTANDAESFGRDFVTISGDGVAPMVRWIVPNSSTVQEKYWLALTWKGAVGLDADAVAEIKIYDALGTLQPTLDPVSINQTADPGDLWLDDGGVWRGWRRLASEISVPAGGRIEVTLTGQSGTPLRVDAFMSERVVERTYSYDANGNLSTATDALGRVTSYDYDEAGRVVKATLPDPDGASGGAGPEGANLQSSVTEFKHDGYGNIIETIERRGTADDRTTKSQYDRRNRLSMETVLPGSGIEIVTKFEYDDAGNLQRVLEAFDSLDEVVTEYDYDYLNRLTLEIADAGRTSSPNSRPSVGRKTEYQYDNIGNVTRSELTVTDPMSENSASTTTTYEYNSINRLIEEVQAAGTGAGFVNATTRYEYDAVGNVLSERDATDRVTRYEYDRLNRLTKSTLPDPDAPGIGQSAPFETYSYDVLGNLSGSTNGAGETTRYIYDPLGRQLSSIDAEGNKTRTRYDAEDNVVAFVDASANRTVFAYDFLDRLKSETIYDDIDNPLSRTYIYNDAGQLEVATDRNLRVRKFYYDNLDQLRLEVGFTDAADTNIDWYATSDYDLLSRLTKSRQFTFTGATYTPWYDEEIAYDNLGRVVQRQNFTAGTHSNPQVKQLYQYDIINLGDPSAPFQTKYTQSVEDSVGGAFNPDAVTTYSMDRLGRMTRIFDDVVNEVSSGLADKTIDFTYDAAGRMLSTSRSAVAGFDVDTSFAYDGVGRLESIDHVKQGTTSIAGFDYQYDGASRIKHLEESFSHSSVNFRRFTDFVYDDAGRLTSRKSGFRGASLNPFAVNNTFTLDESGNRETTAVNSGAAVPATVTANNRVTDDGVYAYGYDNEGNLTSKTKLDPVNGNPTGEQTIYSWDHRNRLTKVTRFDAPGGDQLERVEYRYNSDDLRVRRDVFVDDSSTPSTTEHFVNDGDHAAMILNDAGKVQHRYLYGPGTDELLVDEVFNSSGQAERGYWAIADHLGTVHELVESDADGTPTTNHRLVEHRDYDASGRIERAVDGSAAPVALDALASDFAFAGREWDGDAGLYYNRARWLDADSGRFISEDPIGLAGGDQNHYRYAGGDPVNYRDPTGLWWDVPDFGATFFEPSFDFDVSSLFGDFTDFSFSELFSSAVSFAADAFPTATGVFERAASLDYGALFENIGSAIQAGAERTRISDALGAARESLADRGAWQWIAKISDQRLIAGLTDELADAAGRQSAARANVTQLLSSIFDGGPVQLGAYGGYDYASVGGDFARGVRTSGRGVANGAANAVWSTATLGFGGPVQVTEVDEFDRRFGYDYIAGGTQIAGEVGMGLLTGGLAGAAKGGRAASLARGALAFDVAGNVTSAGRGAVDAYRNGVSFGNSVQMVGGSLGFGGNVVAGSRAVSVSRTAGSFDTVPAGQRLSTYRLTQPGESFIRYETGNPAFTRVTPEGGLTPGTFVAPSSEGLLPQSALNGRYNLPSPELPRTNAFQISPPARTWVTGPGPVAGGTGYEVVFPFGAPPGSVGPVITVPVR